MHENLMRSVINHLTKKIKKYAHFQTVTTNILPEFISNNTDLFRELLANNTTNFPDFLSLSNITDTFRELLAKNTTHYFRVYINQY